MPTNSCHVITYSTRETLRQILFSAVIDLAQGTILNYITLVLSPLLGNVKLPLKGEERGGGGGELLLCNIKVIYLSRVLMVMQIFCRFINWNGLEVFFYLLGFVKYGKLLLRIIFVFYVQSVIIIIIIIIFVSFTFSHISSIGKVLWESKNHCRVLKFPWAQKSLMSVCLYA